jgi:tetratricopeptide (TPR) repeat protein
MFSSPLLSAADTYDASLKAGDDHLTKKAYDQALVEYEAALKLAENPGMKALALGKKGAVYCEQKNYAEAKKVAQEAVAIPSLAPVAQVIALQALGEAQLKGDKDYPAAIQSLEKASQLQGVDWAQPMVNLLLGDAYSFSGKSAEGIAAYAKVIATPGASDGIKAIAWLNTGAANQYGLKDAAKARAAYAEAVKLNPELKATVDGHLAKLQ